MAKPKANFYTVFSHGDSMTYVFKDIASASAAASYLQSHFTKRYIYTNESYNKFINQMRYQKNKITLLGILNRYNMSFNKHYIYNDVECFRDFSDVYYIDVGANDISKGILQQVVFYDSPHHAEYTFTPTTDALPENDAQVKLLMNKAKWYTEQNFTFDKMLIRLVRE